MEEGVNMLTGKQLKNSPDTFGEDPWGTIAKQHYKNMKALSMEKWNKIYLHCQEFSTGRKVEDEDSDEDKAEDSNDVDMSK